MKKFCLVLFLSVVLVMSFSTVALASDIEISPGLRNLLDSFFSGGQEYQVTDAAGVDITEDFYDDNLAYYQAGNYAAVADNGYADGVTFMGEPKITEGLTKANDVFRNFDVPFYKLVPAKNGCPSAEVVWSMSIDTYYELNTGKFTSASKPVVTVDDVWGLGDYSHFYYYTNSVSSSSTISSDKYRVTARGSFKITIEVITHVKSATHSVSDSVVLEI